ncbi:MAG: DNA/RNA non-specific endonuclease, partial [Leptolyngbyaceae bacterium]|nr:DNA/RNA non-specific endonuclease [Leptolyngbyaceae bacterium]
MNQSQPLDPLIRRFQESLKHLRWVSVLLFLITVGCTKAPSDRDISIHLTLGNPSKATTNPVDSNNYLMRKPEYALSYNKDQRIPNWVSWQLNGTWLGTTDRQEAWSPDPDLPADWDPVTPTDYRGSRYDRGHMTPSADRTKDATTNAATFVMTNIVPQTADNNRGPWRELEEYCRDLVREGKELYIVA